MKWFRKIRIIWYFAKALFGTKLEGVDTHVESQTQQAVDPANWGKRQLERFLEIYNINAQDKIDYTNTREDFESNYKHLDDVEDERFDNVTEVVGLKYEEDGKTPANAAEVFDMTYEEYEVYKKSILAIDIEEHGKITYEEVKQIIEEQRKAKAREEEENSIVERVPAE